MTNALTMTSRAAIVAAALAVPALPALAQTPAPADDATTTAPDTAAPDAGTGGTNGGGTTGAPAAGTPAMDSPAMDTPAAEAPGLGGTSPGSSGMAAGDMNADEPSYQRLLSDLRTGRDFSEDLDGIDDAASVTILPLSELQGRDGASSPGMAGDVPSGASDMAPDMAAEGAGTEGAGTDSPSLDAPTADAPTADAPSMGGAATDMSGSGIAGDTPPGLTSGGHDDLDSALDQSEGLSDMREALADNDAVTQALEDADHEAEDVIGLYRDENELTVIVDDRDD
ncbi:hypothetical protein [Paracoccus sp. NSM]|uniref:hypothetical protein n=1 Tax=Paracoccus sp. NSM TaxID=3457784 RepID=UPI004035391D